MKLILLIVVAILRPVLTEPCGGVLTEPNGVVQTPGFPGPLAVPVRCQWLIDSSGLAEDDTQIVLYLTQMYVTSGLRFTEYAFFDPLDPNLQRNPSLLLELTEENSVTTRWLLSSSRFLVIELVLDWLEGNHLRVLDHLLDVYGFNITYQMVSGQVRNDSCSVADCSFAGNCYVGSDYRQFRCSCFAPFSGPACSRGPTCKEDDGPCLNGGVCRHAGKYPTCSCPQGYTGSRCEVAIYDPSCSEERECLLKCNEDRGDSCDCNKDLSIEGERWRYLVTLTLANISSLIVQHPGKTLNNYLEKQLQRFFRLQSLSRFEDLQTLNISGDGQMSFHFFADRHDLMKVREGLQRMSERGRLGEQVFLLSSAHLHHEQGLRLEKILSSRREIVEGGQVTITCIARGSEQIEFTWHKDGYPIRPNAGSGLWVKVFPKNSRDEFTAILGIDAVQVVDEGRYTCHVADWGVKKCKSLYIEVLHPPALHVSPMTASVNKGDNIDLTCVSTNQRVSYSWTRDRNLFPLNPDFEVWEDLKPWGSILRVSNIQRSVTYTCHAQTRGASMERSIRIDLLAPGSCEEAEEAGVLWKPTAPGSVAMMDCPRRYSGHATRYCLTVRPGEAQWEQPDFSNCVSDSLNQIMTDFQVISRGYIKSSLWTVLSELYSWFSSRSPCHRGEGEPVLNLLSEVAAFVNRTFTSHQVLNVTKVFYANIDLLLSQPNSIIHIEKVGKLQTLVDQWSLMWSEHINLTVAHLSYSELVIDIIKLQNEAQYRYYIPMLSNYPHWYTANIAIDVMSQEGNLSNSVSIVNYQNLSKFLPSVSSQVLRDGSELLYKMQSNIISISIRGDVKLRLEMMLPVRGLVSDSWNLTCARTDLVGLEWDLAACHQEPQVGNATHCLCNKPGLHTALVAKFSSQPLLTETTLLQKEILTTRDFSSPMVALGCGSCLFQSSLTLLLLGCRKTFVQLLKMQFCLAVCSIMAIFSYVTRVVPSEDMYQFLTLLLELLFFLALSCHVGKLLIVYTEVVFISNSKSVKRTVIGLTTGVTVLPCLISGTANSFSTAKSNISWWLPIGSASFYTAAVSASLIICLFLMLFVGLHRRLHYLMAIKKSKSDHNIYHRLGLMKRTSALFTTTVLMAISSVLFVNAPSVVNIYIFSSLSALLGFLIFLCYILHSESSLNMKLTKKLRITTKAQDYSSDSDYNLFNFFTKQEPEVESEGPPPLLKEPALALKEIHEKITPKQKLVTFSEQVECGKEVENVDLEVYPNSPKKLSEEPGDETFPIVFSLDIIPQTDTTERGGPCQVAEGPVLTLPPDIEERKSLEDSLSVVSPSEVFCRISNDLDYLLDPQPFPRLIKEEFTVYPRLKSQTGTPSSSAGSIYLGKTSL